MERYYSILGIPNNSTKEVIKKAYYTKMKALHPDKIHGTALEDTATFFTAEITEAYNNLMSKYQDNNSSIQNNQPSFIEEEIYVETKGYLRYTLSNDINTIINEIYNRVKCTLPDTASQIPWNINPALSPNVRKVMNVRNYNYSMTSFFEGSIEYVVINKRFNDNWYISGYEIKPQKKNTSSGQAYNKSYSKESNPFGVFVKILIAVIIFVIILNIFNNQQTTHSQSRVNNTITARIFATVTACEWLNVRNTPSSVNDRNIIEAIRVNTKVEMLERANNVWVRIKYGNGKTGYVHGNFLSQ